MPASAVRAPLVSGERCSHKATPVPSMQKRRRDRGGQWWSRSERPGRPMPTLMPNGNTLHCHPWLIALNLSLVPGLRGHGCDAQHGWQLWPLISPAIRPCRGFSGRAFAIGGRRGYESLPVASQTLIDTLSFVVAVQKQVIPPWLN